MNTKELYIGFAILIGIIVSIVLFMDKSIEKIEIFNTANLTTDEVNLYRQNVSAEEREAHCQIGQLFIDGKYVERDYETAFFHLFLCEKTYSWTQRGRGPLRGGIYSVAVMHTAYKQFIPVFKSNDIDVKMVTARNNALTYAKSSGLSPFDLSRVEGRIDRSFLRAVIAYKRVSSGMTYRDLIILISVLFLILFLYYPPTLNRRFR